MDYTSIENNLLKYPGRQLVGFAASINRCVSRSAKHHLFIEIISIPIFLSGAKSAHNIVSRVPIRSPYFALEQGLMERIPVPGSPHCPLNISLAT